MENNIKIPEIIKIIDLSDIIRIDYALEGDWDNTVQVIWRKGDEKMNLDTIIKMHKKYEPTIEVFFEEYFIGIMCYKKTKEYFEFDKKKAQAIFQHIKKKQNNTK